MLSCDSLFYWFVPIFIKNFPYVNKHRGVVDYDPLTQHLPVWQGVSVTFSGMGRGRPAGQGIEKVCVHPTPLCQGGLAMIRQKTSYNTIIIIIISISTIV